MYKVGIIGYGFVGKAVAASYYMGFNMDYVIDPNVPEAKGTYEKMKDVDVVYICVPSPMKEDGECDTSIISSVFDELRKIGYKGLIISKVTAPPKYYKFLGEVHDNVVYVPEFLVAATATQDYLRTSTHYIGCNNRAYALLAKDVLGECFMDCRYVFCTIEEASMLKYSINSFLATKVVWMNELKDLCDRVGIDYGKVSGMMVQDSRIGRSHMQVPGPDGQRGFGGACFPKDTNAFLTYAQSADIMLSVLDSAVIKNNDYR